MRLTTEQRERLDQVADAARRGNGAQAVGIRHENDEAALTTIFNRFERWQTIRAVLQLLTLHALLWALLNYVR